VNENKHFASDLDKCLARGHKCCARRCWRCQVSEVHIILLSLNSKR